MSKPTDPYLPIGVFDSGVGGLTVCRKIAETLPGESILYLGDTARVPYGSKSAATVERYALACANALVSRGVKLLVVACNTASAFALSSLRARLDVPVLGVIGPGARAAAARTNTGRIGVIGTRGVIGSGIYESAIRELAPEARVFTQACPLFVPFAEEGWCDGEALRLVAHAYLDGLLKNDIDTLVLGCTHYPLLRNAISEVAGAHVALVDSAEETAKSAAATLTAQGVLTPNNAPGERRFLVTDAPETFVAAGERFLGRDLERVEWVDVCGI